MTSPVDTQVKWFTSNGANAPVLTGLAGSLIALLSAVLVDGYDSKTLTSLIAAGGVMTATYGGVHSALPDAVVLVAGVTGGPTGFAGANGEQKVTAKPSSTQLQWATALPDGTYTGTITMKMAPLGWARPFAGTNTAAYKSTVVSGTGCYLRVDDSIGAYARVTGYESMTSVDAGVNPFPSVAQMPIGGAWGKSVLASAGAVPWTIIGDGQTFYIWTANYVPSNATYTTGWVRGFGDAIPLKPGGDPFACFLNYSVNTTLTSLGDGTLDPHGDTAVAQSALARSNRGLVGSALHFNMPYIGVSQGMSGADGTLSTFPNVIDGRLRLSKKFFGTTNGAAPPRADLPGLYHCPQTTVMLTFAHETKTVADASLGGRTMLAVTPGSSSLANVPAINTAGALFFDCTGPWR
ncbi:hypothetical protein BH11PSE13_BH11PSE13_12120 [soil metagenome]